ncbi:MAG: hypothetical protein A2X52_17895 [Candidatus Rokubacteria bacterium GWC2_70_16]|nr:MAG: hypothetical protein A2X52_17895 [Candidatus Rokubacteria bacterium GWC2_70_16]
MRSVADELRDEDRQAVLAMSPAARVALALALGERDLDLFRAARRPLLSRAEARRLLDRQRQRGRRRSGCIDALLA